MMHEAGKETMDWVRQNMQPEIPEDPSLNDRLNDKRNLTPLPVPRQSVQESEAQEEPPTPHDIVQEMRKARGLA